MLTNIDPTNIRLRCEWTLTQGHEVQFVEGVMKERESEKNLYLEKQLVPVTEGQSLVPRQKKRKEKSLVKQLY